MRCHLIKTINLPPPPVFDQVSVPAEIIEEDEDNWMLIFGQLHADGILKRINIIVKQLQSSNSKLVTALCKMRKNAC